MRSLVPISAVLALGLWLAGCSSAKTRPAPAAAPKAPAVAVVEADGGAPAAAEIATDELEPLLRKDSELAALIDEGARRRLQVLAAFPTTRDGRTTLRRSGLRLDAEYFYPASAVKILAAYAAIEKLDELNNQLPVAVSTTTPIRYIAGEGRTRSVVNTTLRRDLELALIISDNDAYDRLFDFVGKEETGDRLTRLGLKRTVLVQHLGRAAKARTSFEPMIDLMVPRQPPIPISHRLGFEVPTAPWAAVKLGRAYIDDRGKKVDGPMDFSKKNAVPLADLQDALVAIARPELYDRIPSDTLESPSARQEVLGILTKLPSELEGTWRGRPNAKDAFHKPLQVALGAAFPDEKLRVYNKGGRAYGFTVENAYIVSERTGRGFFLAAALYANDNDLLNDDSYEYLSVGSPFLVRVGVVLARKFFRDPDFR